MHVESLSVIIICNLQDPYSRTSHNLYRSLRIRSLRYILTCTRIRILYIEESCHCLVCEFTIAAAVVTFE